MVPYRSESGPTPPERDKAGDPSWFDAWTEAAYGPDGFWTRERPADHFRTGAATGPLVARALARMAERTGIEVVVDVGAGDGDLLNRLAEEAPRLRLVGVDRRARPEGLDHRVDWQVDHYDVGTGRWDSGPSAWLAGTHGPALLMAHEWLDDLPVRIARRRGSGWREVHIDASGHESDGGRLDDVDVAWIRRWWPQGRRVEVGRTRDTAWAGLVTAALETGGKALAVDYGHVLDARPADGTLAAYARGRAVPPRPDGTANLTAHVAVDALREAAVAVGGSGLLSRQRQALSIFLPEQWSARPGESALEVIARTTEFAALGSDAVWGRLWWLLVGVPIPEEEDDPS